MKDKGKSGILIIAEEAAKSKKKDMDKEIEEIESGSYDALCEAFSALKEDDEEGFVEAMDAAINIILSEQE